LTDAGTRKPDLIILDLGMPDGDGMELPADLRGWSKRAGHRAVGARQ
jgi:two-component system, OmpR family, KDP operon response regulator KdpE